MKAASLLKEGKVLRDPGRKEREGARAREGSGAESRQVEGGGTT